MHEESASKTIKRVKNHWVVAGVVLLAGVAGATATGTHFLEESYRVNPLKDQLESQNTLHNKKMDLQSQMHTIEIEKLSSVIDNMKREEAAAANSIQRRITAESGSKFLNVGDILIDGRAVTTLPASSYYSVADGKIFLNVQLGDDWKFQKLTETGFWKLSFLGIALSPRALEQRYLLDKLHAMSLEPLEKQRSAEFNAEKNLYQRLSEYFQTAMDRADVFVWLNKYDLIFLPKYSAYMKQSAGLPDIGGQMAMHAFIAVQKVDDDYWVEGVSTEDLTAAAGSSSFYSILGKAMRRNTGLAAVWNPYMNMSLAFDLLMEGTVGKVYLFTQRNDNVYLDADLTIDAAITGHHRELAADEWRDLGSDVLDREGSRRDFAGRYVKGHWNLRLARPAPEVFRRRPTRRSRNKYTWIPVGRTLDKGRLLLGR